MKITRKKGGSNTNSSIKSSSPKGASPKGASPKSSSPKSASPKSASNENLGIVPLRIPEKNINITPVEFGIFLLDEIKNTCYECGKYDKTYKSKDIKFCSKKCKSKNLDLLTNCRFPDCKEKHNNISCDGKCGFKFNYCSEKHRDEDLKHLIYHQKLNNKSNKNYFYIESINSLNLDEFLHNVMTGYFYYIPTVTKNLKVLENRLKKLFVEKKFKFNNVFKDIIIFQNLFYSYNNIKTIYNDYVKKFLKKQKVLKHNIIKPENTVYINCHGSFGGEYFLLPEDIRIITYQPIGQPFTSAGNLDDIVIYNSTELNPLMWYPYKKCLEYHPHFNNKYTQEINGEKYFKPFKPHIWEVNKSNKRVYMLNYLLHFTFLYPNLDNPMDTQENIDNIYVKKSGLFFCKNNKKKYLENFFDDTKYDKLNLKEFRTSNTNKVNDYVLPIKYDIYDPYNYINYKIKKITGSKLNIENVNTLYDSKIDIDSEYVINIDQENLFINEISDEYFYDSNLIIGDLLNLLKHKTKVESISKKKYKKLSKKCKRYNLNENLCKQKGCYYKTRKCVPNLKQKCLNCGSTNNLNTCSCGEIFVCSSDCLYELDKKKIHSAETCLKKNDIWEHFWDKYHDETKCKDFLKKYCCGTNIPLFDIILFLKNFTTIRNFGLRLCKPAFEQSLETTKKYWKKKGKPERLTTQELTPDNASHNTVNETISVFYEEDDNINDFNILMLDQMDSKVESPPINVKSRTPPPVPPKPKKTPETQQLHD